MKNNQEIERLTRQLSNVERELSSRPALWPEREMAEIMARSCRSAIAKLSIASSEDEPAGS